MFSKIRILISACAILGAFSSANATPPSGWEAEGTIVHLFVANENAYCASSPAKVLFSTSDNQNFVFNLSSNDLIRTWVSQLLTAKANGQTVRVDAAGGGTPYTDTGCSGFTWVHNIWVE